nr:MAG: putative glycoprotein 1 [Wufeng rodent arterivirus 1]
MPLSPPSMRCSSHWLTSSCFSLFCLVLLSLVGSSHSSFALSRTHVYRVDDPQQRQWHWLRLREHRRDLCPYVQPRGERHYLPLAVYTNLADLFKDTVLNAAGRLGSDDEAKLKLWEHSEVDLLDKSIYAHLVQLSHAELQACQYVAHHLPALYDAIISANFSFTNETVDVGKPVRVLNKQVTLYMTLWHSNTVTTFGSACSLAFTILVTLVRTGRVSIFPRQSGIRTPYT